MIIVRDLAFQSNPAVRHDDLDIFCWDSTIQPECRFGGFGDVRVGPCTRQFDFDFVRQCRHTGNPLGDIFRTPHVAICGYMSSQSDHAVLHRYCYVASIDTRIPFKLALNIASQFRVDFHTPFLRMSVFCLVMILRHSCQRAHRASLRAAIILMRGPRF